MQRHYDLMNLFTDLTNQLEIELHERIQHVQQELDYLVNQDLSELD